MTVNKQTLDKLKEHRHSLDVGNYPDRAFLDALDVAIAALQEPTDNSELLEEMERTGAACVKSLSYRIVPCDVFDKAITALQSQQEPTDLLLVDEFKDYQTIADRAPSLEQIEAWKTYVTDNSELVERLQKNLPQDCSIRSTSRKWFSFDDNPLSLRMMIDSEPDWAASRILHLEECLVDAITALSNPVQQEVEQWKCFQCGEVFTDKEKAAEHFGHYQDQRPACTIDIVEYRRMEELHRQYLSEETEKDRAMYSMRSEHATALRRAEEEGYNKGISEQREHILEEINKRIEQHLYENKGFVFCDDSVRLFVEGLEEAALIAENMEKSKIKAQQPSIGNALREKLEGMRFDLSLLAASDACFNELEAKCEAFDEAISIADSMSGVTPIEELGPAEWANKISLGDDKVMLKLQNNEKDAKFIEASTGAEAVQYYRVKK